MKHKQLFLKLNKSIANINRYSIDDEVLTEIENIENKKEFIQYSNQNFDSRFNTGLLLTFPELWIDFLLKDWIEISSKLEYNNLPEEKSNVISNINNDKSYSIIIFISKYLKIDPIQYILSTSILNKNELRKGLLFIQAFPFKLIGDDNELEEDLNDFYRLRFEELERYREKIPMNNRFNYDSYHKIRDKANEYLTTL